MICNVFANYMQLYYKKEHNTIYESNESHYTTDQSRDVIIPKILGALPGG